MASVVSELIEEVAAHAQSDNLEDASEICTDGTYFRNNLRIRIMKRIVVSCIIRLGFLIKLLSACVNVDVKG